ncbi:uncharacterized protein C1orf189 homolog [Protopterus annectens]|uniref:uncharacterized protein C1orf189 homolog n=1 Tax=Protopterus annectens TaxID=7888 RepID=UPI001CFBD212|nr:uncharacterized protein C1orf189 homolog [Protopterus annectens]XP_043935857.1 uncharacterized protein C1orf189 homolog [Protopterus annectens]XP_043935858.1 uncharacterized protein C1orf189 homolog [Protopterus annectens]
MSLIIREAEQWNRNTSEQDILRKKQEKDADMVNKQAQRKQEKLLHDEANWFESLTEKGYLRSHMRNAVEKKQELQIANIVLLKVRRAALKQLLDLEYKQYESELNKMGKAVYIERL